MKLPLPTIVLFSILPRASDELLSPHPLFFFPHAQLSPAPASLQLTIQTPSSL